jgi:predicted Zn-dependent protease
VSGAVRAIEGLALAEEVLRRAEAAGATEAEALVMAEDLALTRFANNEIHQNVAETNVSVHLRFVDGRRQGVATSGRTDRESLVRLVEIAASIARASAELADGVALPEGDGSTTLEHPFARASSTTDADPERRAAGARAVIAAAEAVGAVASGSFATSRERTTVANSRGISADGERTRSQILTVMMGTDGGAGYAEACAVDVDDLDPPAIGAEAAERTRAGANPVAVQPGDYPVVLLEYAVVDVLDMLGYLGFSALAVQEDRSFVEVGRRVGSPLVTIRDDGADPAGLPMAYDYEGAPKQPVMLVEEGVCAGVVYDAATAARDGRATTGHGLPAPNPWGPFPLHMQLAAGNASRDDLIGGLDRGLLITRFHYTNPVQPKRAVVTGMTRDGTFLVEGGRIVGPVRNLRYTQSYIDALANVSAIAAKRKCLSGFLGGVLVPALRIDAWTFTSATEH